MVYFLGYVGENQIKETWMTQGLAKPYFLSPRLRTWDSKYTQHSSWSIGKELGLDPLGERII